VFEIPCVGYAASLDEIAPLARAGADFVAIGAFLFGDPRGPAAAIADAAQRLALPETVT
jgi:thiamine-phosphate pyrophosphorylase